MGILYKINCSEYVIVLDTMLIHCDQEGAIGFLLDLGIPVDEAGNVISELEFGFAFDPSTGSSPVPKPL